MTLPISCACCGPGKDIHREEGKTLSLWVSSCMTEKNRTRKEKGFRSFYAEIFLFFFFFTYTAVCMFFEREKKRETELKIFGFRNDSGPDVVPAAEIHL